ncbi:hypothetical protein WICPIJ_002947 [Wickerhamomyces pijperi]|uniref:Zn(2)-C6 fungal-type domain-containing protein n=1 Tax=Wickerhamomyces pijperi TaxID=599730 RepID=A0A9P8QAM6_WICPI|nr:hypothetical protein WICPIJ_002947 [Wickerhamomyces pijperi]
MLGLAPVIKRRRAIKSCENCRLKKLKCDKGRPICDKCTKFNLTNCSYIVPADDSSLSSLDEKILEIRKQLDILQQQKIQRDADYEIQPDELKSRSNIAPATVKTPTPDDATDNKMNRQFLVGSIISATEFVKKHDAFYKAILESCELGSRNASLPLNRISKAKSSSQSTELLEARCVKENIPLYQLIKPHIEDFNHIQSLVMLFFESELYHIYSFLNKTDFFLQFYQLYDSSTLLINNGIKHEGDYLFLGQLLLILRISSLSKYTDSFNHIANEISDEVVPLARLCLSELNRSFVYHHTLPYVQLIMLLNYYQLHSPEYGSSSADYLQFDISRLVKTCLAARYNVDPDPANPQCHRIRKVWFHVLELNYIKFIRDGDPLIITVDSKGEQQSYTTKLPSLDMAEDQLERAVVTNMIARSELHAHFQKIYVLVSDVVTPPPLIKIHEAFDLLVDKLYEIGLPNLVSNEELLKMNQNKPIINLVSRLSRLSQITNVLDAYSLIVNLGIPLFYNYKANKNFSCAQQIVLKLATCTGSLLSVNYFMDVSISAGARIQNSVKYDINVQFGYSLHLMGSILESCNKVMLILIVLLSRVSYYGTFKNGEEAAKYQKMSDTTFKNLKVLLFNIGNLGSRYLFAKEIHLLNVFKMVMNFGKGQSCSLTKGYLGLLQKNNTLLENSKFDEPLCEIVVNNIQDLKGEESSLRITDDGFLSELHSSNESIDFYFEKCLDSFFDCRAIERLEKFIEG